MRLTINFICADSLNEKRKLKNQKCDQHQINDFT